MIIAYILGYLVFSTILATYVYYDTRKDRKFSAFARQFALATYLWPLILMLLIVVFIFSSARELYLKE